MLEERKCGILYLVVPCYNEEEIIEHSIEKLKEKMNRLIKKGKIHPKSKVMFVNDGSRDKTLQLLHWAAKKDTMVSVLSFTTNFGHQSAILAGMLTSMEYADMVITIDADLQQDIEALDDFIQSYEQGNEIVYGVRNDRNTDTFFKRFTATSYYKLLHWLGCDIITNHADYRLLSKKALRTLSEYEEVNLFMRGLIPLMGFTSDIVYFDVKEREAGNSKYTLKKMIKLAIDGITSLSIKPIRIIGALGLFTCIFSVILAIFSFVGWLMGENIQGYTTTILVTLLMNGVTLFSLGIIGEYIGKIYMEAKKRPRYIVDSLLWQEERNSSESD
ncbi:MAG: glycosyltransferase family 2 protein [Lachnospiraceae bacterium]|nr:glycosyltransferase family 2 protein [Lachnospiraceae bacterium]